MGSHAKPRTTGRKTALSALALGATLTGVGLTAAALDPATAVLTANGVDEGGSIQLSGLSTPVSLNLSPAADSITNLTSAPVKTVDSLTGPSSSGGTASGAVDTVGSIVRSVTSGTLDVSTGPASSRAENGIKPIVASTPASSSKPTGTTGSSGSGYTGKHTQPRSVAPPSDTTAIASAVTSTVSSSATSAASTATSTLAKVLPLVQSLVSRVPVVSALVQGSGAASTVAGVLDSVTGTVHGTATASAGDPVSGVVGSLPLVGTLLGG